MKYPHLLFSKPIARQLSSQNIALKEHPFEINIKAVSGLLTEYFRYCDRKTSIVRFAAVPVRFLVRAIPSRARSKMVYCSLDLQSLAFTRCSQPLDKEVLVSSLTISLNIHLLIRIKALWQR